MENQPSPMLSPQTGGIHVSRGVRLRIPAGELVITTAQDNAPTMEVKAVELQLDTCVHWLEIALEHLANAKSTHETLCAAPASSPDLGGLLDREFKASVQAAFSAATFFEALFAATVERNPPKHPVTPRNSKRRPPRYAVVAEQLRRSFAHFAERDR